MISIVVWEIARYSDSADDLETTPCFLHFQDMSEDPRKMENPVVDIINIACPLRSQNTQS